MPKRKTVEYRLGVALVHLYFIGLMFGMWMGVVCSFVARMYPVWVYYVVSFSMIFLVFLFGKWYLSKVVIPLIKRLNKETKKRVGEV